MYPLHRTDDATRLHAHWSRTATNKELNGAARGEGVKRLLLGNRGGGQGDSNRLNEFTGPLPFFVKGADNSKGGSEEEEEPM